MSLEHPLILYIGTLADGEILHEELSHFDWYVYRPTKTLEALAMVVTYMPDIVILDHTSAPSMAEEVFAHLSSAEWFNTPLLAVSRHDSIWGEVVVVPKLSNPVHIIRTVLEHYQDEPVCESRPYRRPA